ncbi:MAG: FecCD family ABC transporter permease [Peptostreptococcaceae bacterium]
MSKVKAEKNLDNSKKSIIIVASLILLAFITLFSMKLGSIEISFNELITGLLSGKTDGNIGIIKDLRLPRVLTAIFIGANLAIAGVLLQAVMKNPLADPGITGISSGASLVAIMVMVFVPELTHLKPLLAFLGGAVAATLVYGIAYKNGLSPIRIVLAGIAINAMLGSMSSILTIFNGNGSSSIQLWLSGSLASVSWNDVKMLAMYTVIGIGLAIPLAKNCNLMVLGDKTAQSLGVDTNKQRIIISAVAVFLASVSTGVGGIISFVGLIVPHIARFIIGSDHKYLIPFSASLGAVLLLLADTIGRMAVRPYEIPVGLVMSVIGAPFFIYLLRRRND